MVNTSKIEPRRDREVFYFRQRFKNRVFGKLVSFFAEEAERTGVTKKDIATRLKRDPAQISRWLSSPSNLTLESISDILLALDAEADPPPIVRFSERFRRNHAHELMTATVGQGPIGALEVKVSAGTSAHAVATSVANGVDSVRLLATSVASERLVTHHA